jgi:hypothetical protein
MRGGEVSADRDPWWLRHPFWAMLAALVGVAGLTFGIWGLKVALSPVKGAGDVIIQQNDADTMIGAQEELPERYHGLEAACSRIGIAKAAADRDPTNRILAANYTGAQQHYLTLVAEYNAMTRKLTAEKMVGNLPFHVETSNCSGVN